MIGRRGGRVRPGLPLGPDESARFLPWVLALMVYVAALGGVGLAALDDTLRAAERTLGATLTLQVPAEASPARVETALAALRQTPGVVAVHLLEPAEIARLLEPVLSSSVALGELPVPRLVDVQIDPHAVIDFATLRQHLTAVVPEARLDDHRTWLVGARDAAHRLDATLAAAIVAALLLIALTTALLARLRLAAIRPNIELLHRLGAADGDIARQLSLGSLRLAAAGGAIGAGAALLTVLALHGGDAIVQLPAPIATLGVADWRLWAVLAASIAATAIIAAASTRAVVLRRLAEMP
jgi:cell division transport system permease protein